MAEHTTGVATSSAVNFAPRGSVSIRVGEKVTLDTLKNIVGRIAGLTGCPACGLLGVDLHLGGDPVEAKTFADLPGVQSVRFGS